MTISAGYEGTEVATARVTLRAPPATEPGTTPTITIG